MPYIGDRPYWYLRDRARGMTGAHTRIKGVGAFPVTEAILGAGGLDYAFFDATLMSSLFQDAAGATPVTGQSQPVGRVAARRKAPHFASQATPNSRPSLQTEGLKFDGSDDSLLSDWLAQTGANCMIAQVTLPASSGTEVYIAGAKNTNERFALSFNAGTGPGQIGAAVGNSTAFEFRDPTNYGGQSVVIGLSLPGSGGTARLFTPAGEFTAVQNGAPTTTRSPRIGALDNNGTTVMFFGGAIRRAAFGRVTLSLSQFQQIRAEWLAGG